MCIYGNTSKFQITHLHIACNPDCGPQPNLKKHASFLNKKSSHLN